MMTIHDDEMLNTVSEKIIGCAFNVSNRLGVSFVEKVYENALVHDLRKAGLDVKQQFPVRVYYDGIVVGEFVADILVNDCVIVELKVARVHDEVHAAQGLNYLRATRLSLCCSSTLEDQKLKCAGSSFKPFHLCSSRLSVVEFAGVL